MSESLHNFYQLVCEEPPGITQPQCSCGWQGDYDGAGRYYDRLSWEYHVSQVEDVDEDGYPDGGARTLERLDA